MNDDIFMISGFDGKADSDSKFAFNSTTARKLDRSGATCDAYECVVQRRRVFIKRLKDRYRNNPLYRAAFSKEYDLGVTLSHPSLPHYVGFGEDYIVMDFIEGDTLADLIKRGDRRLNDKMFVRKLFSELIDVVEYLHHRNIVHCDIKSDNIIISPYPDRPVTLIDLDKAYTSWLGDTSGNPAIYGCDESSDGAIDFKGIGRIAAKLNIKRIAKACDNSNVTADSLRSLLNNKRKLLWWAVAGVVVVGIAGVAITLLSESSSVGDAGSSINIPMTTAQDSTVIAAPVIAAPVVSGPHSADSNSLPPQTAESPKPAFDEAWVNALIAKKSAKIKEYHTELMGILDSDTMSISDKRTLIYDYTGKIGNEVSEVMYSSITRFNTMSEMDVQYAVRALPAWQRLNKETDEMRLSLTHWKPKESRRS